MCFFSEEVLDNSQVSAIQNNRNRCWLFGLQQNFDIGTAFLFGLIWVSCVCLSPIMIEYNFKCARWVG